MKIQTKFNHGDMVYGFRIRKSQRKAVKCETCNGTHRVTINGTDKTTYCPDCHFDGTIYIDEPCCTSSPFEGRIGKIEVEIYGKHSFVPEDHRGTSREKYMLDEHGIGTGSVFTANELFSSRRKAENNLKKIEAEWIREQAEDKGA